MLGGPGFAELLIFGTIALLLFGKRLPSVAKSVGQGIREFPADPVARGSDNGRIAT